MTGQIIYRITKETAAEAAQGALANPHGKGLVMTDLLGGKGAGLLNMFSMGLNVPPAFTIPTTVCRDLDKSVTKSVFDGLMAKVINAALEADAEMFPAKGGLQPLVSVRSGAAISMPGMMDTILNVGITSSNVDAWGKAIGERAAFDSYRRMMQMIGATACGIDAGLFEHELREMKAEAKVEHDHQLPVNAVKALCGMYQFVFDKVGIECPNTREKQLEASIKAVFNSWSNPRAITYREMNGISHDIGTACTVQRMVFGNKNNDSGTGVMFSRNPATGEPVMYGEFLRNAQGEDVVAGIRTPEPLDNLLHLKGSKKVKWNIVHERLADHAIMLEKSYRDMVDVEFTIEDGELFILQARPGKRTAQAAFRVAVDLVAEGVIKKEAALSRLTVDQLKVMRRPVIDPAFKTAPDLTGIPGSPGVVRGRPVFNAEDAEAATDAVILVTHETDPDDIKGMAAAVGILTKTGGATSHAAVVARGMDKPCVVGCTDLDIDAMMEYGHEGLITIDGATGRVWLNGDVPVIDASNDPALRACAKWAVEAKGYASKFGDVKADGMAVVIHSADFATAAEFKAALEGIHTHNLGSAHIVINIAGHHHHCMGNDHMFMDMFGARTVEAMFGDRHTEVLNVMSDMAQKMKGASVIGGNYNEGEAAELEKMGYHIPVVAGSLTDLFNATGPVYPAPNMQDFIGNALSLGDVQAMLKAVGKEVNFVKEAPPSEYALFTVLAR